jgi:hypothetical protein
VDRNVEIIEVDGKEIVKIYVPRVSGEDKPIYIGHNPFTGTYRRNYEGNYKCTKEDQDSKVIPNYSLNDLIWNRISSGLNVNNSGPNAANSGPNENEQTKDHEKVLLDISELARKKKEIKSFRNG